jgi:peptidoglycan/LPS O-acetylase OafA/YrhL
MHQNNRPIFFPNLDGLRFFCFLSVFFYHSFATQYEDVRTNGVYKLIKYDLFNNGNLGVNFFFVLSGFLITYLLLTEKSQSQNVHIGKFYLRRALRIWPLFYFCIFFGFVLFPFLKSRLGGIPNETAHPIFYFLFANNLDYIKHGADSSVLSVLWSVAIEEQFYLVWPILLTFSSKKKLPYILVILIIISFLFRFFKAENDQIIELHTFSCISDMMIGGIGAYFSFYSSYFINKVTTIPKSIIILVYISTFGVYILRREIFHLNTFTIAIDRLIISILFLFIILEQNFSVNSFYKMGRFKNVSKLGQYTYGLYCLHMIGILIAATVLEKLGLHRQVWQVLVVEGLLSLSITLALAYISYHFYEKKFLLLKNKFAFINTSKTISELKDSSKR